jgi:F0F1-type ATP synthase assembly protein I
MAENPFRSPEFGKWMALTAVGFEMFVPIVIGAFLDRQFGWQNWGTLAGVVIGFVGGLMHLVVMLKRFQDPPDQSKQDPK